MTAVRKAHGAHKGRSRFTIQDTIESIDGTRSDDGAEMLIACEAYGVRRLVLDRVLTQQESEIDRLR